MEGVAKSAGAGGFCLGREVDVLCDDVGRPKMPDDLLRRLTGEVRPSCMRVRSKRRSPRSGAARAIRWS